MFTLRCHATTQPIVFSARAQTNTWYESTRVRGVENFWNTFHGWAGPRRDWRRAVEEGALRKRVGREGVVSSPGERVWVPLGPVAAVPKNSQTKSSQITRGMEFEPQNVYTPHKGKGVTPSPRYLLNFVKFCLHFPANQCDIRSSKSGKPKVLLRSQKTENRTENKRQKKNSRIRNQKQQQKIMREQQKCVYVRCFRFPTFFSLCARSVKSRDLLRQLPRPPSPLPTLYKRVAQWLWRWHV